MQPKLELTDREKYKAELAKLVESISRWFTDPQTVTHPSTETARRWFAQIYLVTNLLIWTCSECDDDDKKLRRWTQRGDAGETNAMRDRVRLRTVIWLLLSSTLCGGDSTGHMVETGTLHPLRVARGFYAFIQPTDISVRRSTSASHCKITVDLSDLSTLQVGSVQPHVRSYHFFVCLPLSNLFLFLCGWPWHQLGLCHM